MCLKKGLGSALQGGNAHGNRKKIYRPQLT